MSLLSKDKIEEYLESGKEKRLTITPILDRDSQIDF